MDDLKGALEYAVDVIQGTAEPTPLDPDQVYSTVVPDGHTVQVVQLGEVLDRATGQGPRHPRGTYAPSTVEALEGLLDRHADASTTVWVSEAGVVAVFNDHHPAQPGWADHRAVLTLVHTPEWSHWLGHDGMLMTQEQFAEHIEDGLMEVVEPDGATMLEVAQHFHASTGATFRSAHRLDSGQVQLTYDEHIDAKAGKSGQLEVPRQFVVAIEPYDGEPRASLTARLRYRLRGGTLQIGYKLDRPHVALREALQGIAARLREQHPDATFEGRPIDAVPATLVGGMRREA